MNKKKVVDIDEYIAGFPESTQLILQELRNIISAIVPEAREKISYQMPTFELSGNLVYFAGYKNHIGFYPGSSGVHNFINDLSDYEHSKGTIRFPLDQPLPVELIRRIVAFRVKENQEKSRLKRKS